MRSFVHALLNKAPIAYIPRGFKPGGAFAQNQTERLLSAYGSVGTLFSIVSKLSTGVASVNWHLYKGAPGDENAPLIVKHPAKDVWDHPNPFYTQGDFVETFMQHLDLVGEAWWLIARSKFGNAGPPLELWPVRPDKMAPVPDPENFISGYVYKNGQEAAPLNLQDVILLKQPNPLDLYRGAGPVQSVLMELDSDRFSAQWNRNFFLNDATPGGIVELNSTLSDAEFEEFNLRWREQHQGIANSHRVALLEKGATWKERQFSQKDMQFNALRDLSRDRIMEAFGFPKPILGIVTDVNRANAEAAEVVLARWLIKPRLERIKQTLNEKFLPLYGTSGQGVFFDYDDPTPDDRAQDTLDLTAKCNAAKTLVEAGFDPAEVCAYLGLPDLTAAEIVAKAGI